MLRLKNNVVSIRPQTRNGFIEARSERTRSIPLDRCAIFAGQAVA